MTIISEASSFAYDVSRVRADFPILAERIHGKRLAFLDTAASSQRPLSVIEAVNDYERHHHANIHRGVYQLSQRATDRFEGSRERVREFLNAHSEREIIFTRGTTEAINLVANTWGQSLKPGDEILITWMEHHANIVPWQMLCERTGARLKVIPITRRGELDMDAFEQLLSPRTRLLACTAVSNALGTVLPLPTLIAAARRYGALVLVDAAQAVAHQRLDVQTLDCDFLAFSGHKLYGPTGIGVLYAREAILRTLPPWQGGGDMILTVSFTKTTYNDLPYRFEAGTPNISGAVGLAAAIDYVLALGIEAIAHHEHQLLERATERLQRIEGLRIIGEATHKTGVISFTLEDIHPHDLGTILDSEGVAVRTGHHCAMPVMEFFDVPATARASFGCYSCDEDIDQLIGALERAREVFG